MWKTTYKGLLAHKLRMILTAIAVVLGVGFIAGTFVLTDTMNKAFDNLFTDASRGIDVYVRAESSFESQLGGSRQPIPEDILETVESIPGVEVASGSVTGYAQFIDAKGEAVTTGGAPTLGGSWSPEPLGSLEIRDGAPPTGSGEVVVDAATATEHGFQVGDSVEILTLERPRSFTVSGIAGFGEADNLGGATFAAFDLATAQELMDREGQFDAIEVAAEDGVSAADLRDRITQELPGGIDATTGTSVADEQSKAIQEGLGFFNVALLVFAGIALFVGAFLIFNTFSITVAQRTREFGLLRALGASGGQVMTSVLVEALVVSLVASAIGLLAGIGIAVGLQGLLSAFGIDLPSTTLVVQPRTVIVSLAVGVIVTLVAAVAPARRAARVSPMAALRAGSAGAEPLSRRRIIAGAALTALGVAVLLFGLFGNPGNPAAVVGAGAFVVFLGVATLTPLFAGPLASLIGDPFARTLRVPGRLARENAARNPKRTASTAAALMIGLALVAFVGIFGASLKASTDAVYDESLRADFMVDVTGFAGFAGFSPQVAEEVDALEEVVAVAPLRQGQWRMDNTKLYFLTATDPETFPEVASIEVSEGELSSLSDGGVFLFADTAEDLGLSVGDELAMEFAATGVHRETVDGLFENKTILGTDYLVSLDTYDRNFPERADMGVFVKTAPGISSGDARTAIEGAVAAFPNVSVLDRSEVKEDSAQQVDQVLGLVTALLGLALIIALLGITNTLALSVFERTRELGLLRAIGMMRRQMRAMIRWEAVIISLIGAFLGLIIGTFFGWALVEALASEGVTELAIPSGQLVVYLVVAALAGILAAIPPARRAARLNVLDAIATE